MNRRDFFKTTTFGIGATVLMPTVSMCATEEIPLYKQFGWLSSPMALLYRIKVYKCGYKELESMPVTVKTFKCKLTSDVDVDYTQEQFIENKDRGFGTKYNQIYYTNKLLLNEAKKAGFTHIYCFVRTPPIRDFSGKRFVGYCIRGVKCPDWKLIDGKIPTVFINTDKNI